jgi:hypothetical protein
VKSTVSDMPDGICVNEQAPHLSHVSTCDGTLAQEDHMLLRGLSINLM